MSVDHSRLYDRGALRALEAAAIARLDGDGFALMARAGQAGWRELLGRWPQAQRIVVACGPGNNGGDGYVLALHAQESGRQVSVMRLEGHAPRGDLARRACDAWVEAGGRVDVFEGRFPEADAVVDAVFGIGLSRAPEADATGLVEAINAAGAPVMTKMLSLLDAREIGELRSYLERCVEGLEEGGASHRDATGAATARRTRGEPRHPRRAGSVWRRDPLAFRRHQDDHPSPGA